MESLASIRKKTAVTENVFLTVRCIAGGLSLGAVLTLLLSALPRYQEYSHHTEELILAFSLFATVMASVVWQIDHRLFAKTYSETMQLLRLTSMPTLILDESHIEIVLTRLNRGSLIPVPRRSEEHTSELQ